MSLPWYIHTNPVSWILDRAFNPTIPKINGTTTETTRTGVTDTFGGNIGQGIGEGVGSGLKWIAIIGAGYLLLKNVIKK